MKRLFYPIVALTLILSSAFVTVSTQEWSIKDDYSIKFTSKDPSGSFKSFKGTIVFDEADLANSKFDVSIDVNSINMGNGMKNKKSQTSEWFDESKFPTITFTSTKIEKGDNGYKMTGNLKLKGKTKKYAIPFKFNDNKFVGNFNVKRSDFGVGDEDTEVVPDIMKIEFSVPVSKK